MCPSHAEAIIADHLWAQIPFFHDTRPEIFDEHISLVSQLPRQLPTLLMMQVDGDAAPVSALQTMAWPS